MKKHLKGLTANSYEHELDRRYLSILQAVPGLSKITNTMMNWVSVKWDATALCGSNFHVTRESCFDLFKVYDDTSKTLDLEYTPPLYLQQHYDINAFTFGYDRDAYIVSNIGTIDKLDDDELAFIFGHEMGHVKSGHTLYHTMSAYLSNLIEAHPLLAPIGKAIHYPLMHWYRMSEFTADRAGLLACQDLNKALSAMMKMTGLPERYYKSASVDGFIKQVNEFETRFGGLADKTIREILIFNSTHPWTIFRASELIKWYECGEYQKVIEGCKVKICPGCGQEIEAEQSVCPYCGNKY